MVDVNYLSVLGAGLVSMIIGALWYGPVFGGVWAELMGWSKKEMEKMAKEKGSEMNKLYAIQFVGSLVMAFVLAHSLEYASAYLGTVGVWAGIQVGFWSWLGFVAPVTLTSVLWEGKSWKLYFLNNAYYLVTLLAIGILLSIWN